MEELMPKAMNLYSFIVTAAVFIITLLVLRMILKTPDNKNSDTPKGPDAS
ncbi:MAG: hypothetical protein JKY27_08160 [Magnetovibrio sp.]|nr:hypothetical protein [Magnetovibrio sp.]